MDESLRHDTLIIIFTHAGTFLPYVKASGFGGGSRKAPNMLFT